MIDSQNMEVKKKDTGDGNTKQTPIVIYICVFMVILEKKKFLPIQFGGMSIVT